MRIGGYEFKITKSHSSGFQPQFNNTYITKGQPVWRNFSELIYLLNAYYENPIVQAVINIKAEAFSNMKFFVKDIKNGEIVPLEEYDKDKGKLNELISQPNPLQSTIEWLRQFKVNREVFGNGYSYAAIPVGFENRFTYADINAINNLPSYLVTPVLTGKWLEATTKEEIIKEYVLRGLSGKNKPINTNKVLHSNNVNIKFDQNFTQGVSNLLALKKPISNIDSAYESINVITAQRGALGLLSSDMKDEAMGSLPLKDHEIKKVQEEYKKYGTLHDQYSLFISNVPLKYQKMAMSMKELMLFETVSNSAIALCHSYGVPEDMVRYYIKTGTLGADNNISEKRLYDSTIIPYAEDFTKGLNNFFKTKDHGIRLIGSYDHVKVLQKNQKDEAETEKIKTDTAIEAFRVGAITYNDVLESMGMPNNPTMGGKYIWDLTPEQLNAIGVNDKSKENEQV